MRRESKFDICRVHTNRFKTMSARQLIKASDYYSIGKGRRIGQQPTQGEKLVRNFLYVIEQSNYLRPDLRSKLANDLNRTEQAVWDHQVQVGCKIKDYEEVDRDADRQGDHNMADNIRKQRGLAGRKRRR